MDSLGEKETIGAGHLELGYRGVQVNGTKNANQKQLGGKLYVGLANCMHAKEDKGDAGHA